MEPVDVVIVGSGASGAAAAWSLSRNPSLKILCLEQGERTDPANYPTTTAAWELSRLGDASSNPQQRNGPGDYPIDDSTSPISIANFNGFGGSTILYSGHFPRMHPSDFATHTLDGVGDDWPFTYADLEPYFTLNEKMMGVAGLVGRRIGYVIQDVQASNPLTLGGLYSNRNNKSGGPGKGKKKGATGHTSAAEAALAALVPNPEPLMGDADEVTGVHLHRCWNCHSVLMKPLLCGRCKAAVYCTSFCAKNDWEQRHSQVCTEPTWASGNSQQGAVSGAALAAAAAAASEDSTEGSTQATASGTNRSALSFSGARK